MGVKGLVPPPPGCNPTECMLFVCDWSNQATSKQPTTPSCAHAVCTQTSQDSRTPSRELLWIFSPHSTKKSVFGINLPESGMRNTRRFQKYTKNAGVNTISHANWLCICMFTDRVIFANHYMLGRTEQ